MEIETVEGFNVYPADNSEESLYTTSSPNSAEPDMQIVRCRANVRRYSRRGIRYISSITVEKPYLEGVTNVQYVHPIKGPVTRNVSIVTPLSPFKLIDPGRQFASISWFWELNYRYTFLQHETKTYQLQIVSMQL